MLKSSCHIIATMRSKIEYAQITENGKPAIKKLGMAPIQREGMEYEFTVFLDLSVEHIATPSKDRTGIFDGQYFKPSVEIGLKLMSWLNCDITNTVQEVTQTISQAIPQFIPPAIVSQVVTDSPDVYQIMNSEAKTKINGQVFAKVVLLNNTDRIVAWSAAPEILDLPSGTTITAKLIEKNSTHLIESYSIIKGGEAA